MAFLLHKDAERNAAMAAGCVSHLPYTVRTPRKKSIYWCGGKRQKMLYLNYCKPQRENVYPPMEIQVRSYDEKQR